VSVCYKKRLIVFVFFTFFYLCLSVSKNGFSKGNQGLLEGGVLYYGSSAAKSLSGTTGYFYRYNTSLLGGHFRPNLGAQIEYGFGKASIADEKKAANFSSSMLEAGYKIIVSQVGIVTPFLGINALLGWASLNIGSTGTVSVTYGVRFGCGAEIRFTDKEDAGGIRLSTGYRIMRGSLAGLSGFELNAFSASLGVFF